MFTVFGLVAIALFLFFMFKSKTMWSCSNIFCLVERLMAKSLKRI